MVDRSNQRPDMRLLALDISPAFCGRNVVHAGYKGSFEWRKKDTRHRIFFFGGV